MKTFIGHIRFSALLLPAVAALLLSCGKLQPSEGNGGGNAQDGDATVQIVISSAPDTRSAKDGDIMNNLRVWIVDSSDKVTEYASQTPNAQLDTVKFSDVVRGEYTLYILANSSELSTYVEGSTIDDTFRKAAVSLPGSSLTYPEYSDSEGMPLSLKKSISVGPGMNHISAAIVRICGQINVTINNRTKANAIYITGVSLSQRSPSSGYLFQQDDHSSPSAATQGALASNTTPTRIEPGEGSKMLSCYLFENCSGTDALELTLSCNLYDKGVTPTITTITKSSYKATGEDRNTDIDASKYYFITSASTERQFLMIDGDGDLALNYVGTDEELFVKSDITNYLWQLSSINNNQTTLKNVSTGTYLNIAISGSGRSYSSSYSLGNELKLTTGTSTGRQFYLTYKRSGSRNTYYSYLYNNSGKIGVTSPATSTSTAENTGWYLREATVYEYTVEAMSPDPVKSISGNTSALSYTDSYGIVQPLQKICRNDKVNVIVNLFYNPHTSTFDYQVVPWTEKTNETTFD